MRTRAGLGGAASAVVLGLALGLAGCVDGGAQPLPERSSGSPAATGSPTDSVPRAAGVTAPEPPCFETFVARYAATGYEHWSPYGETLDLPPDREMERCPDTPPDEVLYGNR